MPIALLFAQNRSYVANQRALPGSDLSENQNIVMIGTPEYMEHVVDPLAVNDDRVFAGYMCAFRDIRRQVIERVGVAHHPRSPDRAGTQDAFGFPPAGIVQQLLMEQLPLQEYVHVFRRQIGALQSRNTLRNARECVDENTGSRHG